MLGGDGEIELYFEITGGSDCPRFQLTFKHLPSDQESSFSYLAWSRSMNALPRPEVDYPDLPMPGQYTFSSFLSDVQFERHPSYPPAFDAIRTWRDQEWNYPLRVHWRSEESPIGINVDLATQDWSQTSRAKFDIWKILKETGTELTLAIPGSGRVQECWSFFASQPSPTLPPWWRYANPTYQHQTVVRDLPSLEEGTELSQYHRRLNNPNFEIVPMVYFDRYLTPIEYEVFAIGSLLRSVEGARAAYSEAFNGFYQFSLDPTDGVFPQRKGSQTFFIRLVLEPWMFSSDTLLLAPNVGTDVTIRTQESEFFGRILTVERYVLVMEVKRTLGTGALVLSEQRGNFRFGNPDTPFIAVRQAISGVMWGRLGIPEKNWLKILLLAHENAAISSQSIGTPRSHPSIVAHNRLNDSQRRAFVCATSFGESLKARLTVIEGPPGTGKTAVLLAIIVRALACGERILICAETNFAVRSCASILIKYVKERGISFDGIRMVQRNSLEALCEGGGYQRQEESTEEPPEYMDERMRLQLITSLEREADLEALSLTSLVARKIRFLNDPETSLRYSTEERTLLGELEHSRKAIMQAGIVRETEQSTELVRYGSIPTIIDDDSPEDQWIRNMRKLQKAFDKCWYRACQYYIRSETKVVFVTAATATSWILKGFRPTTLVMDEASQMAETATVSVVATFFESVQKLVLAGDLMQNSPFLGSDSRNEFASTIKRSFMERMMRTGVQSIFLSIQYRMHPHISDTISRHFYGGRLVDGPNVSERAQDAIFRQFLQTNKYLSNVRQSHFFDVPGGRMYVSKKGGSKVNPQYASAVQRVVRGLITAGAPAGDIAILSFYSAQLQIHQRLSSPLVNTMTVGGSQAREFDFVIVDTVSPGGKEYPLGFLTDSRKINVALSRAKHGLIIVGSQHMGKVLHQNHGARIWNAIIQEHRNLNSFSQMNLDAKEIETRFDIPGEHYVSAKRDGHH